MANNTLERFLQLSETLCACSDEELARQLHGIGLTEPKWALPVVRALLQSGLSLRLQLPVAGFEHAQNGRLVNNKAEELSKREREILGLLAAGQTMSQIGERLFISPATVNNHCANMRGKLGLRGRKTLLSFAITKGAHLLAILIGYDYMI